eukprot:GHRR01009639.1.p1 GENE.GHRR01009639.1~~GHRR01009639.1.p1  ORF type:complete len:335 (+),score=134.93 GHRR01009639.1:217-1221(+)
MHKPPGAFTDLVKRNFPPIEYGFAYGSGAFKQPGLYEHNAAAGSASGPMLDFIFVVDDPQAWHEQNLQGNRHHYSFLKWFGPRTVIKYGVVGMKAFQQDLCHWSQLYLAGRLQKPVAVLTPNPEAEAARQQNLQAALTTALLLSPKTTSLKGLFKRITSLSYLGDVRMGLAEDNRKVERIVAGSYDHFKQLYLPLLKELTLEAVGVAADAEGVQQPDTLDQKVELFSRLPGVLIAKIGSELGSSVANTSAAAAVTVLKGASAGVATELPMLPATVRKDIAAAALKLPHHRQLITSALRAVVSRSSRRQAVAGFLYAGPIRSLRYLGKKLAKAWL